MADNNGQTPLHLAISHDRSLEIVQALLQCNQDAVGVG
jgi:ankyrin repeat protein